MDQKDFVRNISIIAHVDAGKTTTTDSLVARAGLISEKDAGEKRWTDTRDDEATRGITIKSTGVSMRYEIGGTAYNINLVDSPGHVDFSQEVTAALRITDGSIVVLDAIEGVCVQTETVLRQALAEQVKPIVYINKIDRYIFELKLSAEEIYQRMVKIIESVNNIVSIYRSEDSELDLTLDPANGIVMFGSAYHGWGFSLMNFAKMMAAKTGGDPVKLMKQLWGEKYFDPETKKITTSSVGSNGKPLERTFCKFVMQPLLDMIGSIINKKTEEYTSKFNSLGIKMSSTELASAEKDIYKIAMKRFLPLADTLLDNIIAHLPSPKKAQQYRYKTLYDGPMDDECATAIKNCDENGPVMIYISKLIPMENGGRFYAFGRVFSGTVTAGLKVRVLGSNFKFGSKDDVFENKTVQRVARMIGGKAETCESVTCGNTVALVGIDQYISKSGTITTSATAHPIKTMKFSVSPIVQVAVSPKNPAELPKLVEAMKKLSQSDPCVKCFISESGDHIIAGVGELHMEICLKDLRDFMKSEIIESQPIVPLRETITVVSEQCLSKSPNKHNRLYMTAEPLNPDLVNDMANGTVTAKDDPTKRARYLADNYGWEVGEAKKIWAFGPEGDEETNVIVDITKGVQYMNEIKDHVVNGFKANTVKGVLCQEPLRGVRFNIQDVVLHADAIHRGGGQMIPTAQRCINACLLTAQPRILEPMYQVKIQTPQNMIGVIYNCLQNRRGEVTNQEQTIGEIYTVTGYLPVLESFGFNGFLREHTGGQGSAQLSFDHWRIVPGDPLDVTTFAGKIVIAARERKGLTPNVPSLDNFLDKL